MFTGIIQAIGEVAAVKRDGGVIRLTVRAPKIAAKVKRLESVCVNGVCLTVVGVKQGKLLFEIIPETQRLSGLSLLRPGSRVNLEPGLSLSDRLNGHIVLGHCDATGKVIKRAQLKGERVLWIKVDRRLRRFLAAKGSVAVDGVSLTVGSRPSKYGFSVHLIPETLKKTTLGSLQVNDAVNIEADYIAKLVAGKKIRGT